MPIDLLLPLQILLVVTCGWCGWQRGMAIARGSYHPLNVVTVVHAWFSTASVVMQWLWGTPSYQVFLHLRAVNDSRPTWIAYYSFSTAVCLAFNLAARHFERKARVRESTPLGEVRFEATRRDKVLMWIGLISPLVAALFSPDDRIWSHYAAVLDLQPNAELATFVNVLYWATYIAVLSACGLILAGEKRPAYLIPICVFTFAALWLNGKRNIVILATVLILLSLRIRGILSKRGVYLFGLVGLAGFLGYSQWYQGRYRPIVSSFDTYYEMARMDFSRDADIRMALYAELEEVASPILGYRGQGLLFDLFFFIPRSVWEDKPLPYYFYITSTALQEPRVYRTWGIATTFLSEAIANLGLAGLIVGPLFIICIAVSGYRPDNPFLTIFTCVICTLFLSIHLAGFTVLWSAWCVFVASSLLTRRRSEVAYALSVPPDIPDYV
jgi:hypothetical protein